VSERAKVPVPSPMPSSLTDLVPAHKREAVERALASAFGSAARANPAALTGGASGAHVYRVTVREADCLLRIEANVGGLHDPVRQYACMRIASDAGVAPRVPYADATDAVAILEFVHARMEAGDDARRARLSSLARTVATLHESPLFPPFMSFFDAMEMILSSLETNASLPPAILARLLAGYRKIADAYPRDGADLVSSHNDLNPNNVLFEGERAWLIDWELAFANDRYNDIAALMNFFATEPSDVELILRSYFGDSLRDYHRSRAFLMQQVNRIYYAVMMLNMAPLATPGFHVSEAELETRSLEEMRGEMAPVSSGQDARIRFACVLLRDTLAFMETPSFEKALAAIRTK
jgi:aminoglycoside phosphotransferase (APT) family kinase protein